MSDIATTNIGVRDQLCLGGLRSFARIFSVARQRWKTRSGGGGGEGFMHLFLTVCLKTSSLWPHINHISCNTRSKHLESTYKNQPCCPKIKWFGLNIICNMPENQVLLPEYGHLKNPGGGGGASFFMSILVCRLDITSGNFLPTFVNLDQYDLCNLQ